MKKKVEIAESGKGPALKHNPFAALGGVAAASGPVQESSETAESVEPATNPTTGGRVVLRREKKGRGGKTVVVVAGFESRRGFDASDIAQLAQHLKQQLGCGGAVERAASAGPEEIVLQGDQPARVAELLRARGFRVGGVTQ